MTTLHIEHPVTDLETWTAAFARFAEVRRQAGVTAERVLHPDDDVAYVVIDLDFDTNEHAHAFAHFLRTEIWAVPDNSPALAGTPEARVLEPLQAAESISTGPSPAIVDANAGTI